MLNYAMSKVLGRQTIHRATGFFFLVSMEDRLCGISREFAPQVRFGILYSTRSELRLRGNKKLFIITLPDEPRGE